MWVVAGTPVVSHTVLAGTTWWQDPGYRTPRQLLAFGRGLTRVAYGGTESVWDSLYSTAWGNGFLGGTVTAVGRSPVHLDLMAAGLWLGLIPTGLIVAGAVAGRRRPRSVPDQHGFGTEPGGSEVRPRPGSEAGRSGFSGSLGGRHGGPIEVGTSPAAGAVAFARGSVGLFLAAVVWVYLTLPIYSCAKASYLLSTLPCVALLAAAGWDRVVSGRWGRAVAVGLLACWAVASYGAYVVTG